MRVQARDISQVRYLPAIGGRSTGSSRVSHRRPLFCLLVVRRYVRRERKLGLCWDRG